MTSSGVGLGNDFLEVAVFYNVSFAGVHPTDVPQRLKVSLPLITFK